MQKRIMDRLQDEANIPHEELFTDTGGYINPANWWAAMQWLEGMGLVVKVRSAKWAAVPRVAVNEQDRETTRKHWDYFKNGPEEDALDND